MVEYVETWVATWSLTQISKQISSILWRRLECSKGIFNIGSIKNKKAKLLVWQPSFRPFKSSRMPWNQNVRSSSKSIWTTVSGTKCPSVELLPLTVTSPSTSTKFSQVKNSALMDNAKRNCVVTLTRDSQLVVLSGSAVTRTQHLCWWGGKGWC